MKRAISVFAMCLMAACGGTGGSGDSGSTAMSTMGPPASLQSPVVAPSAPQNTSFAGMLNNVRANAGAGPVSFDARLGRAAQAHANDMLANGYFSHTGLNGSSPGDRITAQGYRWRTYGENIARGQSSEAEVLEAWQNSAGHRQNNENPNFQDFGLARAGDSRPYWVLVLATEQ